MEVDSRQPYIYAPDENVVSWAERSVSKLSTIRSDARLPLIGKQTGHSASKRAQLLVAT